ncbi:MAG: NUDIX hydrolase [Acidobacteriaceae bacterium]
MSSEKNEKPIRTISSREVYRNPWCRVREDVIERSDGARGIYGVMDKEPAVLVIPLERVDGEEFVWLVRQYRYTVGDSYYELPQGSWEETEVNAVELARGELAEETGLRAERMTRLADLWIAYGAMRQIHHVFLAEGLSQGETERDPEEHDMTVHRVAVSEFETMLLDGRVMDNCTAAAWGVYRVWKDKNGR